MLRGGERKTIKQQRNERLEEDVRVEEADEERVIVVSVAAAACEVWGAVTLAPHTCHSRVTCHLTPRGGSTKLAATLRAHLRDAGGVEGVGVII